MPDTKISADATVTPAGADFVPIVQGGDNKKATLASVVAITHSHAESDVTNLVTDLASKQVFHGIEAVGAITFNNTTHVLSLASVTYWYQGTKYTTASPITCDLDLTADRTGTASTPLQNNTLSYLMFTDSTGKLYWSTDAWSLRTKVPVVTLFWNGTTGAIQRETHGHTRNLDWHANAHLTIGARYQSGLALTNMTGTGTGATWTVASGTIWDEDLQTSISQCTETSPGARVWYQTGASSFTFVDQAYPFIWNGGTSRVRYVNATYVLTDLAANQYMNMWVYGSADPDRPIYFIATALATPYTSANNARTEQPPSLSGLGINADLKVLWRMVVKGDGTYDVTTPPPASDFRATSSLPGGGSTSVSAASVSYAPTSPETATNVQTALNNRLNYNTLGALSTGLLKVTTTSGALSTAAAGTDFVGIGAVTSSGLTMATSKVLGRTTASTGAIEELAITGSGSVVLGTSPSISSPTITGNASFVETTDTVYTITDGAAFEIDPSNGNVQVVTLGASRTPAATNFAAGQTMLLGIDDGTAYSITWSTVNPTWVKPGGTASAPTLATTGYTWILLWKVSTTIYAAEVGKP